MRLFSLVLAACNFACRLYMKFQGLLKPKRVAKTIFGASVNCDILDFIQRRIYFFGVYEPELTRWMRRTLKPGQTFVDIGANVGYFSILGSRLVGENGHVIAVEATPSTHRLLQQNIEMNALRNVRAFNVAATKDRCRVNIVKPALANIGRNQVEICDTASEGSVQGVPATELLDGHLDRVGVVKIDIEGSEGPVLEDILENIDRYPANVTIASEISSASAGFVRRFHESGFDVFAMPNIYSITHYLLVAYYRQVLGEDVAVELRPVESYDERYSDYVFVRRRNSNEAEPVR